MVDDPLPRVSSKKRQPSNCNGNRVMCRSRRHSTPRRKLHTFSRVSTPRSVRHLSGNCECADRPDSSARIPSMNCAGRIAPGARDSSCRQPIIAAKPLIMSACGAFSPTRAERTIHLTASRAVPLIACRDMAASSVRRRGSAAGSNDCYRAVRLRARTSPPRGTRRRLACLARAESPASKAPAQHKDRHSRIDASRVPLPPRASRKLRSIVPCRSVSQDRGRFRASPAPASLPFYKLDARSP